MLWWNTGAAIAVLLPLLPLHQRALALVEVEVHLLMRWLQETIDNYSLLRIPAQARWGITAYRRIFPNKLVLRLKRNKVSSVHAWTRKVRIAGKVPVQPETAWQARLEYAEHLGWMIWSAFWQEVVSRRA
jgi:hypothetical protein